MKAIAYHRYGGPEVLELVEIEKPAPRDGEVLVRVAASAVTAGDYRARSLDLPPGFGLVGRLVFGLSGPRRKVLGAEYSGIVEAVGAGVSRFAPGDPVVCYTGANFGGYAEYAVIREDAAIVRLPESVDLTEAAALPFGGSTALHFLRAMAGIKPGDAVLVIGAAGIVGSAAVQIAKSFGASVTGVAGPGKGDMLRGLGADAVFDYTRDDPAATRQAYDIILDTSGTATYARYRNALRPGGRLLQVSASLWQMLGALTARKRDGHKASGGYAPERAEDLEELVSLAAQDRFRPLIDSRYPLAEAAAAHARFEARGRGGTVLITVAGS